MSALLIKNMPAALHERLRRRAREHHRSMNREVITILERELDRPSGMSLPPPVKTLKPLEHQLVVRVIRDARSKKIR